MSDDETLAKKATVIIYYFDSRDNVRDLVLSLRLLRRNLLVFFPYPVLIFFPRGELEEALMDRIGRDSGVQVRFEAVDFQDAETHAQDLDASIQAQRRSHYFQAIQIYREAVFAEFDWYLRLQADSMILSPFTRDPFEEAMAAGKLYVALNSPEEFEEDGSTNENLLEVVADYTRSSDRELKDCNGLREPEALGRGVFCPGFQLSSAAWWRSPSVAAFLARIDSSGGVLQHGWSHSSVQTLAVSLLCSDEQIRLAEISYTDGDVVLSGGQEPQACKADAFAKVVAGMPQQLVVACVNLGYVHSGMVENWYRSLQRIGLDEHVLIIGLDPLSVELLAGLEIPATYWRSEQYPNTSLEALRFRRVGWKEVVFSKVELVKSLLQIGKDVLFSDSDVVFLEDPLPYLLGQDEEFCIQSDARGDQPTERNAEGVSCICSGFYFARATAGNIRSLTVTETEFSRFGGDQDFISDRLKSGEMDAFVLPRERFPNGHYWRHCQPLQPWIVHFNWLVGVESKSDHMKASGLWLAK